MKKTRSNMYISIFWNSFDINELIKILWIKPTESYRKWKKNLKNIKAPLRQETSWEYSTWYIENYDISINYKIILTKFADKVNIINKFVKNNNLDIKITISSIIEDNIMPWLYFEKDFIKFLNNIWAELDIDIN